VDFGGLVCFIASALSTAIKLQYSKLGACLNELSVTHQEHEMLLQQGMLVL